MKTLSAAQEAALAASVKKPVWLLELELASADGAATLYLSDREVSLWGRAWKPLVLKWGAVDTFFDPSMSEVAVADVSLNWTTPKGRLRRAGEPGMAFAQV